MRFEGAVASAHAEVDTDTIRIELGELTIRENCYVKSATLVKPWDTVVGASLDWIWLLTNQQGYEDGLRYHQQFIWSGAGQSRSRNIQI